MKFVFLSLLASLSLAAGAAQTWQVTGEHPLWKALKIKAEKIAGGALEKRVGSIVCTKNNATTVCKFPDSIPGKEIAEFYKLLDVEAVDTNGAYTEIKTLDRLMVVADTSDSERNDSALYLDHPCRKVSNKKQADACMDFWATKMLPSFEEPNSVILLEATNEVKDLAIRALVNMGTGEASVKMARDADYIGMMEEIQDESRFYYWSVVNGENSIPQRIMELNPVDIEYTTWGEKVKEGMSKEEFDAYIKKINEELFLGVDISEFSEAPQNVCNNLEYLLEK